MVSPENLNALNEMHKKKAENTDSLFDYLERIEKKLDILIEKSNEDNSKE